MDAILTKAFKKGILTSFHPLLNGHKIREVNALANFVIGRGALKDYMQGVLKDARTRSETSMRNYRYFMRRQSAQKRARRRGAALIEFALIASIFFTMLLGLIQFGLYQSTSNTLWNLSREGARFASVSNPTDAQIKSHVTDVAPPNIKNGNLTIGISPAIRSSGGPVTVTLTYDMKDKLIFPTVSDMLKKTYTTSSTMRVE